MLKFVTLIPLLAAVVAVAFFAGSVSLILFDHIWWSLLTSFGTTIFGAIAYTGYKAQQLVGQATDTAMNVAGKQVERVADAVIDRVNKSNT